jgi:hypothetical protein
MTILATLGSAAPLLCEKSGFFYPAAIECLLAVMAEVGGSTDEAIEPPWIIARDSLSRISQ